MATRLVTFHEVIDDSAHTVATVTGQANRFIELFEHAGRQNVQNGVEGVDSHLSDSDFAVTIVVTCTPEMAAELLHLADKAINGDLPYERQEERETIGEKIAGDLWFDRIPAA